MYKIILKFVKVFVLCMVSVFWTLPIKNEDGDQEIKNSNDSVSITDKAIEINLDDVMLYDLTSDSHLMDDKNRDDMETAESAVFRPLFVYKQQMASRRRIYEQRNWSHSKKHGRVYRSSGYPRRYFLSHDDFPVVA